MLILLVTINLSQMTGGNFMNLVLAIIEIALILIPTSIVIMTARAKWKDLVNPINTKEDKDSFWFYEAKMKKQEICFKK